MPTLSAQNLPVQVDHTVKAPESARWPETGPVSGAHPPMHGQREHGALMAADPPPSGHSDHLVQPGPHRSLWVYRPRQPGRDQGAALMCLHGGDFIAGSPDHLDTATRRLTEGREARADSVDHKLAPEYPRPVQIEERESVVRWLVEHAAERDVAPGRISLDGDSAGSHLTCSACLEPRDEQGPKLAAQLPLSPETAMPVHTRAGVENGSGGQVDTAGVPLFVWPLPPQGTDHAQPYATPLLAPRFHAPRLYAPSRADWPRAFDLPRDVGRAHAQELAAGSHLPRRHDLDLPPGIIRRTVYARRCLEAAQERAAPGRNAPVMSALLCQVQMARSGPGQPEAS